MKVRMIIGEHLEHHPSRPVPQTFLECVSFPMHKPYYGDDPDHPAEVEISDEKELREWATSAFQSYEVWDMKVPSGAVVGPEDREDVRRRELALAEALVALSTVYDGPRGDILDALHEARAVLRRARKGKVVSIEEFALAEDKIAGLIRRASEDTKQ